MSSPPSLAHGAVRDPLDRSLVRHVGGDGQRLGAERAALRRDLLERVGASRGQHDRGAASGELQRRRAADAARGAGDDGDAAVERTWTCETSCDGSDGRRERRSDVRVVYPLGASLPGDAVRRRPSCYLHRRSQGCSATAPTPSASLPEPLPKELSCPVPPHSRRRLLPAAVVIGLTLSATPAATAETIVHLKGHDVWVSTPDGSRAQAVTSDGTADRPYLSPSQADDGTIAVGHGEAIVLLRQNGTVVRRLDPPPLVDSVSHPIDGVPVDVAISPDGTKVAYGFARYSCPVGASCGGRTAVGYMSTDGTTGPEAYAPRLYLRRPSWVGNGRTLLFGGYGSQVNVHDLGPGSQAVHWFDDDDTDPGNSTDLGDGELTRQGDKLAVIRGYGSTAQVRWYAVQGDALSGRPAVPAKTCQTTPVEGTHGPSWSPDGTALAAADGEGVHVIRGITTDPGSCTTLTAGLVLPGAREPDWGPAPYAPEAAPPPVGGPTGGGATPPPTGGPAAPPVTTGRPCADRPGGAARQAARGPARRGPAGDRARPRTSDGSRPAGPRRGPAARVRPRPRTAARGGWRDAGPRRGALRLRLRFDAGATRRLRVARSVRLAVRVTFRPNGGGRSSTRVLRLTLRR
jgi:hypothetical protein